MDRASNLIKNIIGSFTIKGFSILVNLLMMPAYLKYFHQESILGIWLSVLSILTWVLNFDMGLGNGLRNSIVGYLEEKKYETVRQYVTSAYVIMAGIAFVMMALGSIAIYFFKWNAILNVSVDLIPPDILTKVVLKVFLGLVLYFVTKMAGSILLAMEKTALVNSIHLTTNITILVFVLIVQYNTAVDALNGIADFYVIAMNLPYIVATFYIFGWKYRELRPKRKSFSAGLGRKVMNLGGIFFIIQIMLLVINSSNEIIISNIYGPEYVVEYQIYYKLFYCVVMLFSLISNPIWSNVAKAYEQRDFKWVRIIRKRMRVMAWLGTAGILLLTVIFPYIADIWLGKGYLNYHYSYGVVFALFSISMVWVLAETSIANGLGLLKIQAVFFSAGAFIKILVAILLKQIDLVPWIAVIACNVFILVPFIWFQKKSLDDFIKNC